MVLDAIKDLRGSYVKHGLLDFCKLVADGVLEVTKDTDSGTYIPLKHKIVHNSTFGRVVEFG